MSSRDMYRSPKERAERGILSDTLTLSEIAQLWAEDLDPLPPESEERLRFKLCVDMEHAIRKYLQARDEGMEIPSDALVCEDDLYVCPDAWRPRARGAGEDGMFASFSREPKVSKDNFEKWAKACARWDEVVGSKLRGWFESEESLATGGSEIRTDEPASSGADYVQMVDMEVRRFYDVVKDWLNTSGILVKSADANEWRKTSLRVSREVEGWNFIEEKHLKDMDFKFRAESESKDFRARLNAKILRKRPYAKKQ